MTDGKTPRDHTYDEFQELRREIAEMKNAQHATDTKLESHLATCTLRNKQVDGTLSRIETKSDEMASDLKEKLDANAKRVEEVINQTKADQRFWRRLNMGAAAFVAFATLVLLAIQVYVEVSQTRSAVRDQQPPVRGLPE